MKGGVCMAVDKRQLAIQIIKTATEMGASREDLCNSYYDVLEILKETKKDLPLSVTHEDAASVSTSRNED